MNRKSYMKPVLPTLFAGLVVAVLVNGWNLCVESRVREARMVEQVQDVNLSEPDRVEPKLPIKQSHLLEP